MQPIRAGFLSVYVREVDGNSSGRVKGPELAGSVWQITGVETPAVTKGEVRSASQGAINRRPDQLRALEYGGDNDVDADDGGDVDADADDDDGDGDAMVMAMR